MATEYKLPYTAKEIDEKLGKIDSLAEKKDIPSNISDLTNDSGFITQSYVQEYAQPKGDYALKNEIPDVAVQSVNNKTGAVNLTAEDVGALPDTTVIPTVPSNISAFTNDAGYLTEHQSLKGLATEDYVNDQIAAIPAPDISEQIETHNTSTTAHEDIREQISQLSSEIVDIKDGMGGNYTNLLPAAVSVFDISQVLTGTDGSVGYLNDTRFSTSQNAYISEGKVDTSGLMKAKVGDKIRLKNVSAYIDPSNDQLKMVFYASDGTRVANYDYKSGFSDDLDADLDESGNLVEFTIPRWNENIAMFSIACQDINEKSVITANEDIIDTDDTRFTELESSLSELTARVAAIENLDPGDGDIAIPSYWVSALEEGAEAINTALCTAGMNKSAFLFYSDAHWNYGSQMSPTLLKYLYRHTGMTKTFFGGDIVNNEAADYNTMSYLWDWRNQLKDLPNHHSVVGNHDDGNATNNLFSEQYVYGYLFAAEETSDVVRNKRGMYYYLDNSPEQTRYLFLDTAYRGVDTAQQTFIKNALISTPEGWHIVAVAHIWYDTNYDTTPPTVGNLNSGSSIILTMFDNYNARSEEFAECGGWVEFCVGGHTHRDYNGASTSGIPIILVETDSEHVRSGLSYAEGTTSESSVNGIIADYDNHKIYVVRIGRGESREVEIVNYVVNYKNVLPSATTNDKNTIYNNKGWKENTRWSDYSSVEKDADGIYLTGFIPVSAGNTIYLKNVTMPKSDEYDCVVFFWKDDISGKESGAHSGTNLTEYNNAIWGTDGNLKQFTIPTTSAHKYIRIQCGGITDASIITINEPIE